MENIFKNDYILLTPGPLTTTKGVRKALLKDMCTWDDDYNSLTQEIRRELVKLVTDDTENYTAVLLQGSGTYSVEGVISSSVGEGDKLLIISNGAYGDRMVDIARANKIKHIILKFKENEVLDIKKIEDTLKEHFDITHISMIHLETTTGILNNLEDVCNLAKKYNKTMIVDAMSSMGAIPIDVKKLNIDFLISSANKCIQGVPGFGFIICNKESLIKCKDKARSLSLDIYDQWISMEKGNGKWRFTSPTHVVRAFHRALIELKEEGGVLERNKRYSENQKTLVEGLERIGIKALVDRENQSPVITTFLTPESKDFSFNKLYLVLKDEGFVIYPGKLTEIETFRIGTIGDVYKDDIERLVSCIGNLV